MRPRGRLARARHRGHGAPAGRERRPRGRIRPGLERKEALIEGAGRADLVGLTERIAEVNSDLKEIGEAVAAGDEVIAGLDSVIAYFKSAGNWGIVDLIGGGLIVTAVKHSKIDRAKAAIHEVQARLRAVPEGARGPPDRT
ncbi:MAG: hypothetical protein MZW92_68780 [Comamonadaceae bacterium]|nr:hypothetical protein [Comamonadaceae bacterium]